MRGFLAARATVIAVLGLAAATPAEASSFQSVRGTVKVAGATLAYVREGQGPPIVIVGSATYYPKAFSQRLREQFELIFLDSRHFVPAYSPSKEELSALTLETFADDVEVVRQHLGVDRIAVLGHSVHAQIAFAYALKYPSRTTHLIMVAGIPYARPEYARERERFWEQEASADRKAILARNLEGLEDRLAAASSSRSFAVRYMARGPLYWANPTFDATELLRGLENGPALERLNQVVPSRADVRRSLESLRVPTLVLLGRLDFSAPHTVWEALIAGLNNIAYVLLKEDSHSPQTEAPDRFDQELTKWFNAHTPSGRRPTPRPQALSSSAPHRSRAGRSRNRGTGDAHDRRADEALQRARREHRGHSQLRDPLGEGVRHRRRRDQRPPVVSVLPQPRAGQALADPGYFKEASL